MTNKFALKNVYDTSADLSQLFSSKESALLSISNENIRSLYKAVEVTDDMLCDYVINTIKESCLKHNVTFITSPNFTVSAGESLEASGYYDPQKKELAVATGRDKKEWLATLLHEYSHLEQDLEQTEIWKACFIEKDGVKVDMSEEIDKWLSGHEGFDEKTIFSYITLTAQMEYECEQKTAQKILSYGLSHIIPVEDYSQKALAYVLFYFDVMKNKKWYNGETAPYRNEKVYPFFPKKLDFKASEINFDFYNKLNVDYSSCY